MVITHTEIFPMQIQDLEKLSLLNYIRELEYRYSLLLLKQQNDECIATIWFATHAGPQTSFGSNTPTQSPQSR